MFYTRTQLVEIINREEGVILFGKIYTKIEDLPSEEDINNLRNTISLNSLDTFLGLSADLVIPTNNQIITWDSNAYKLKFKTHYQKGIVAINPGTIEASSMSSKNFSLSGAFTTDNLLLNPPVGGLSEGLAVLQYYVNQPNEVIIVFFNTTSQDIVESNKNWNYLLVK